MTKVDQNLNTNRTAIFIARFLNNPVAIKVWPDFRFFRAMSPRFNVISTQTEQVAEDSR